MALARVKTWGVEILTDGDLDAEFDNILNNPISLISPLTGGLDWDGQTQTLDAAAVTTVRSSSSLSWDFTSGAKSGTPATTGSVANWTAQTFTDSATAASGTAAAWVGIAYQRPTLAATNVTVTTTDAATVYIPNSPAAGTNETITNAWSLWIDAGNVRFDGDIHARGGTITTGATTTLSLGTLGGTALRLINVASTTRSVDIDPSAGTLPVRIIASAGSLAVGGGIFNVTGNPVILVNSGAATGALCIGADSGAITLTNATTKAGRICAPHYTNAEEPVSMISLVSTSSQNTLEIGGSSASLNAATEIVFFIGATGTSLTGTEAARFDSAANLKYGGTASRSVTQGTNVFSIFDGTAPVGTLTNGCSFYVTTGEMRVMDAGGTATLLSPHDGDLNWIHYSIKSDGKEILIRMEQMARLLDEKFGADFVAKFGKPFIEDHQCELVERDEVVELRKDGTVTIEAIKHWQRQLR